MIVLQPDQVCPFSSRCSRHNPNMPLSSCQGATERDCVFICDFADSAGNISEGPMRNSLDKTGRMNFIQE